MFAFFFSSRRRHTRFALVMEFRRVLFRSNWAISLEQTRVDHFSAEHHTLVSIDGFLTDPETAVRAAILQNFASITPQYPGLRAPLDPVEIGRASCRERVCQYV